MVTKLTTMLTIINEVKKEKVSLPLPKLLLEIYEQLLKKTFLLSMPSIVKHLLRDHLMIE